MTELSRYSDQMPLRAGVSGMKAGSATQLDVSAIMELAGETAFAWDFARDVITWDQHGAQLLTVAQISDIATGAAFQLRIAADSAGLRRKVMVCPKSVEGGGLEELNAVLQSPLDGVRVEHVIGKIDEAGVDELQVRWRTGIKAFLQHPPPRENVWCHSEPLRKKPRQFRLGNRHRQLQVGNSQGHQATSQNRCFVNT